MDTSPSDGDEKHVPPKKSSVILLLGTIADTTWRMFAPTLLGAVLGYWADTKFGIEPWLSFSGLVIGIAITAVLIRQQLRDVEKNI